MEEHKHSLSSPSTSLTTASLQLITVPTAHTTLISFASHPHIRYRGKTELSPSPPPGRLRFRFRGWFLSPLGRRNWLDDDVQGTKIVLEGPWWRGIGVDRPRERCDCRCGGGGSCTFLQRWHVGHVGGGERPGELEEQGGSAFVSPWISSVQRGWRAKREIEMAIKLKVR